MAAIKLLSLNCHGYNAGTESYLRQYCHDTDVFLLQETWLEWCEWGFNWRVSDLGVHRPAA